MLYSVHKHVVIPIWAFMLSGTVLLCHSYRIRLLILNLSLAFYCPSSFVPLSTVNTVFWENLKSGYF